MASTLQVTLTENVEINGTGFSSTKTKTISTITNIYNTLSLQLPRHQQFLILLMTMEMWEL